MALLRDLWNDPDPIKWVIFGSAGASVVLGGLLLWQRNDLASRKETIARWERRPANPAAPAPAGSLQQLADKANEAGRYHQQLDKDDLAQSLDNPTEYVYSMATSAGIGDPTVTANPNANAGPTYKDTVISVQAPRDRPISRENIQVFLFNIERSMLISVTYILMTPQEKNHKPGMPLVEDFWFFDTKFTIRQKKLPTERN